MSLRKRLIAIAALCLTNKNYGQLLAEEDKNEMVSACAFFILF